MVQTTRERFEELELHDERLLSIEIFSRSSGQLDTIVLTLGGIGESAPLASCRTLSFISCTGVSASIDLLSAAAFHNEIGDTTCRPIGNFSHAVDQRDEGIGGVPAAHALTEFTIRFAEPAGSTISLIALDFVLTPSAPSSHPGARA